MRTFEPKKAASYMKTSPKGVRYTFTRGNPVEPKSRFDEIWMDQLVSAGTLICVNDPTKNPKPPVNPRQRHTKTEDFYPNLPEKVKKPVRPERHKSQSEKEAEETVAKTQEKLRQENPVEEITYEDKEVQEFWNYIKSLRGKNEDQMIQAIYAQYLKDPLIEICESLEMDSTGKKDEVIERLINHFSMKG